MLARGTVGAAVQLQSELAWVNDELNRFAPNLLAHHVVIDDLPPLVVVAVYAPAWPVSRERLRDQDVSTVKLSQNPDVWVADLLVVALKAQELGSSTLWIIAGDFNSCESFDMWKGGPRGNREWLDRMAALDLVECLRHSQGALTPTFRRPSGLAPRSQIDHIFASRRLSDRLLSCRTGDPDRVYGHHMSDHLPIIADFASFDTLGV
jgi:endonuclease/exonuclease/phosphatase family metal-dependent hydrolase